MKITKMLLMLLIWVFWSGNALAKSDNNFPGPGAPPPMRGGPPGMQGPGGCTMWSVPGGLDVINVILRDLSLTDEQREQIKAILDGSRDKMNAARGAIMTAQKALFDAVKSDANEVTIRSAANALGSAIGDEAVLKVQILQQIEALHTQRFEIFRPRSAQNSPISQLYLTSKFYTTSKRLSHLIGFENTDVIFGGDTYRKPSLSQTSQTVPLSLTSNSRTLLQLDGEVTGFLSMAYAAC